jgi:hypothetical protein
MASIASASPCCHKTKSGTKPCSRIASSVDCRRRRRGLPPRVQAPIAVLSTASTLSATGRSTPSRLSAAGKRRQMLAPSPAAPGKGSSALKQ